MHRGKECGSQNIFTGFGEVCQGAVHAFGADGDVSKRSLENEVIVVICTRDLRRKVTKPCVPGAACFVHWDDTGAWSRETGLRHVQGLQYPAAEQLIEGSACDVLHGVSEDLVGCFAVDGCGARQENRLSLGDALEEL